MRKTLLVLATALTPLAALADGEDALVEGTPYHATGMVPCMASPDADMTECAFGVIRGDDGTAQVDVTAPDGTVWSIMFDGTAPVSLAGPEPLPDLNFAVEGMATIVSIGLTSFDIYPEIITGG
jgi:hypothetical protein